ncbi:hypothetical protein N7457_006498 [Penicillium paradoxum]|uniref:uncharacterized protein n=1 Tax=Penicillium paradoxum TaxID=176176 RepID=UPI0025488705|nr:uncharacterized protein N7457_006498 [Penicillium paradoxum]KAJ5781338.1 hypothetical protein N7457_006498 [Penicillium paradoxum]
MLHRYLLLPFSASYGTAVTISVAKSGGNFTTGVQYGAMEEEINHCGEGGLYAELIRNRAFQGSKKYPSSLDAWSAVGSSSLSLKTLTDPLSTALPTSVNIKGMGTVGLTNAGLWGIDVRPQKYTGSFYVKGSYNGSFRASLLSSSGKVLATAKISSKSTANKWVQYEFVLTPAKKASDSKNSFSLTFDGSNASSGSLDFNLISLFPPTWNNRPNGMRKDLMQAMAVLCPKFLRFPGGNNLEGDTIEGLQYMEWCDDLCMEPILAAWAGLALNGDVVPEAELDFYVQDALNEIEFLTGSVDTEYGALRAKIGHPDPWTIRYVEVGNEDNLSNGLSSYKAYRFSAFYNAITTKYPEIQVLASTIDMKIPGTAGGDYHLYDVPDNFVTKFDMFDSYTPEHPILLCEIAATEPNNGFGIGSVAEAVFLLGAERNADKIIGTTYAPFLMNLDSYQWCPTILSFNSDPDQTARSTSWHVYSLFNHNHMTDTLPATSSDAFGPLYYATGLNNKTDSHTFKAAVYNRTADVPVSLNFDGVGRGTKADLTIPTAPDPIANLR